MACTTVFAQGSIGINTDGSSPAPSAILDVKSINKGLLVPRMTSAQRTAITSPATGLLVFDNTTGTFWYHNGTTWTNLAALNVLRDADGNTKIQVEKNPNEDVIRFDLGGTENMVLRKNAGGSPRLEMIDATLFNTFFGKQAGAFNTTGYANTALGENALVNNTEGYYNTASGLNALGLNTTGYFNTAHGANALSSNSSGTDNTANGYQALRDNTMGNNNTAIGRNALLSNNTGKNNTAAGMDALSSNTSGSQNTANGKEALFLNSTGSGNTATGAGALFANKIGSENTAIGQDALSSNTASGNTAHGYQALHFNTTGTSNTAIGNFALLNNTNRSNLVAVGDSALFNNGMNVTQPIHATGNTAVGSNALYYNTTGFRNTAVGDNALRSNIGGYNNTANGEGALMSNTTGVFNTAHGTGALMNNTDASVNTAFGAEALFSNTNGSKNTATGGGALYSNIIGEENTATGDLALFYSTGNNNTAVGSHALYLIKTGHDNTAVGYSSNYGNMNNLVNTTTLGAYAIANADNKVRIGNTTNTVIEGQVDWTFPSDARFKFNIHDQSVPGLSFINKLRPVTYQFDTRKFEQHMFRDLPDSLQQRRVSVTDYSKSSARIQTGFLAQEVEQVCKELGYEFGGLHVPQSHTDNYGLAYASFVPLLVKAVQEQQVEIVQQKKQNKALEILLNTLVKRLEVLEKK